MYFRQASISTMHGVLGDASATYWRVFQSVQVHVENTVFFAVSTIASAQIPLVSQNVTLTMGFPSPAPFPSAPYCRLSRTLAFFPEMLG